MALAAETLRPADTRTRILDAAFRAVAGHGLSRFTMDDVAREARMSRQSVYRYFENKDALIVALVYREEEQFIEGVRAAHAQHPELEDAVREAVLYCLRIARTHPLLDRLLASEPDVLLPYLTTRGGGLIARARGVLEELTAERPRIRHELVHRAADLAVRAIVSYVISPSDDDPEDVAAGIAAILASAVLEKEEAAS